MKINDKDKNDILAAKLNEQAEAQTAVDTAAASEEA